MTKKIGLLSLWISIIALFFVLDINQWLSFEKLQSEYQQWQAIKDNSFKSYLFYCAIFFISYLVLTTASLPGAAILTLAAGALFGFWQGLLLVSFASSLGATLSFLLARHLFRDTLKKRFSERLTQINTGLTNQGHWYLLSLRVIPIFPFFLINLLMGLTEFKATRFYLYSQIGMLPGTMIFVYAGTQLASIQSIEDIFSLPLLLSLSLLGILPILLKKLLQSVKYKKEYNKPRSFDYNLIVIGAGAAGLVSSYMATSLKAKILLIEKDLMGGDCLNHGCVPSKSLISSAAKFYQAKSLISSLPPSAAPSKKTSLISEENYQILISSLQKRIQQIAPKDSEERYQALGADVIKGHAEFIDPWHIKITESSGLTHQFSAQQIIIATGSSPIQPVIPGIEEVASVTTDTLWQALYQRITPPKSLLILGAGPVGVELSQSFSRLGIEVHLICQHEHLLMKEDSDVRDIALNALRQSGVTVHLKTSLHSVQKCTTTIHDNESEQLPYKAILLSENQPPHSLGFDLMISAIGRKPRLESLGLHRLGFDERNLKELTPNESLQLSFSHLYMAGDCVGGDQFTHLAAHHAWYASMNALFGVVKTFKVDNAILPQCIYIDPCIARVGLTEQEAKNKKIPYHVTHFALDSLDRAITDENTEGFIKVLTQPKSDKILGVCIVAKRADDMLSEFTLAMKYDLGLTKILRTPHPYPTWSEGNKHVAGVWQKERINPHLLRLLARFHQWRRE